METTMDAVGVDGDGGGPWGLGTDAASSPTPAVRGRRVGHEGWTGSARGEGLATFLGWFSLGLGALELLAPGQVGRMIGLEPGSKGRRVIQAMGVREIGAGLGILANPRSKEWTGSRIGGDLVDLALLGAALSRAERPQRTLLAAAAVVGVAALDVIGTEELARSRKLPTAALEAENGAYLRRSVTIGRPRAEVYAFWRELTNLPRFMEHLESVEPLGEGRSRWRAHGPPGRSVEWEARTVDDVENERIAWRSEEASDLYNAGLVRFEEAPAGRGTVVTVEMWYAPPGGALATGILKLFRREPRQQIADDLRRLKQVLETGEVVLSDATAVPGLHPGRPRERQEVAS